MLMLAQALLYEDDVMQCRNNRENKSCAQKNGAGNPDPTLGMHLQQEHEKDGADLRNRVGLSENARTEIAKSRNHEEHRAGRKDGNVAAENDDCVFPWDLMQNRQNQEDRAEEKLVRDGVEILSK